MPAYTHIPYRKCPVCGRPIKNFEAHTRNREDHQKFRRLQNRIFQKLATEFPRLHPGIQIDSGITTSLNQTAWIRAIEQLGGSSESVEVKLKLPKHAITEDTICPKTGEKVDLKTCHNCIDMAVVGSSAHPKYRVCMELRRR